MDFGFRSGCRLLKEDAIPKDLAGVVILTALLVVESEHLRIDIIFVVRRVDLRMGGPGRQGLRFSRIEAINRLIGRLVGRLRLLIDQLLRALFVCSLANDRLLGKWGRMAGEDGSHEIGLIGGIGSLGHY